MSDTDEEYLKNHILIDGVAGHLFPITEAAKISSVHNAQGVQIPQIDSQTIANKEMPEFFDVELLDGEKKKYKILLSEVNPGSGFKALAYQEVSVEHPHQPITDEKGKCALRFNFQGLVEGKGDYLTTLKLHMGKYATHTEETEKFTREAINAAGGAGNISAIITGSHSYGAVNALQAYHTAKQDGVEQAEMIFLEAYAAKQSLEHFAKELAGQQLRAEDKAYDQTARTKRAKDIFHDFAEHITTVNNHPSSFVINPPFHKSVALPVGDVYALDVSDVTKEKNGKVKELGSLDRHRLSTMMQAVYSGADIQYRGAVKDMETAPGRGR